MKVLWLVNIMLPAYAEANGLEASVREGWLTGLYERFLRSSAEEHDIRLAVCFPGDTDGRKEMIGDVSFYRFREDLSRPERYDRRLEKRFRAILDEYDPDLVHIFGTEFPHALAMARACGRPGRILIGIQGICSEIAGRYRADLPEAVWKRVTPRDLLRRDSLIQQQEKYRMRGVREKSALLIAGHVTGRTAFDREFTRKLLPHAVYHHMNETMRAPFYEGQWTYENAVPHTVFVAQGDYPLKGLHFLLRALPYLRRRFPDLHVTVAGNNIIRDKLRIGAYGEYLQYLIRKNNLADSVTFTGSLTAQGMREQYLRSHVFACPSVLENSPNALGEAMLTGVPCIASRAGGIPSMLDDGREGILFPAGDVRALAEGLQSLLENRALCEKLSAGARVRAGKTFDGAANVMRLNEIYREMAGEAT